jgi:cephalosporin hydroxylase
VENVRLLVEKQLHLRNGHVMVMLDSDHSKENVSNEMDIYSRFVTKGSYLIVEDTNVNGHPSAPEHGPGPFEAVQEFLKSRSDFELDMECQRHLLTFNPSGWLRKI